MVDGHGSQDTTLVGRHQRRTRYSNASGRNSFYDCEDGKRIELIMLQSYQVLCQSIVVFGIHVNRQILK